MSDTVGDVHPFDADALDGGYVYTRDDRLSCRLARQRHVDVLLEEVRLEGLNVLDLGCGDGFNTVVLWDRGRPRSMTAADPAERAIELARRRAEHRPIRFRAITGERLPFETGEFDAVLLVGVLHHVAHPDATIAEALRVAPEVVLLEPNGWNAGLKVIERTSAYHREHNEKSHTARRISGWIRAAGGRVASVRYAGLVPFFCPDWMARSLKVVEPMLETVPLARTLGCAFTVIRGVR